MKDENEKESVSKEEEVIEFTFLHAEEGIIKAHRPVLVGGREEGGSVRTYCAGALSGDSSAQEQTESGGGWGGIAVKKRWNLGVQQQHDVDGAFQMVRRELGQ